MFKPLAATINAEELAISARLIWVKNTSIMIDSFSKNLQIGDGVAKVLQSSHILYHLLGKCHPLKPLIAQMC